MVLSTGSRHFIGHEDDNNEDRFMMILIVMMTDDNNNDGLSTIHVSSNIYDYSIETQH